MITSYFERRLSSFDDRLRAEVRVGNFQAVELQPPPPFRLRIQPGVHNRDARGAQRMRLHRRRGVDRICAHAELRRGFRQIVRGNVAHDKRSAVELMARGFERLLSRVKRCRSKPVTQRDQRAVGIVIDQKNFARAVDAARRVDRS